MQCQKGGGKFINYVHLHYILEIVRENQLPPSSKDIEEKN